MDDNTFRAVDILKSGGVIAYPSDTVFGLGADIYNESGVSRIREIKGSDPTKPFSVAVADRQMLSEIAFVSPDEEKLLSKLLPGSITVLLPKKNVPDFVTGDSKKVGVRLTDYAIMQDIIGQAGFPIITTSANEVGTAPAVRTEEINLPVDFIVPGVPGNQLSSTVVDLAERQVLRKGADLEKVRKILSI